MSITIPAYILYGPHDSARSSQVALLQAAFPNSIIVEPIFPKKQKVPFVNDLIRNAFIRKGIKMLPEEVGVFMSHRKIWQDISKKGTNQHFVVLESDSQIKNPRLIETQFSNVQESFDLFFWGAWNNHVSIQRSTKTKLQDGYRIGTPLIRSVYGAYGYSLNAKAAKYLLKQSKKINNPVDLYKYYVDPSQIKIGAISPEVISTWQTTDSTIRREQLIHKVKRIIIIKIFHLRNQILAYFC